MTARTWMVAAGVSGALAVALGAFGAHGLADAVSPERLATWRTASSYHLAHAVALAVVALAIRAGWSARASGVLFVVGTVLFSGSLYLLVLLEMPILGAVAPIGGVAFITGWLALAWTAWRTPEA